MLAPMIKRKKVALIESMESHKSKLFYRKNKPEKITFSIGAVRLFKIVSMAIFAACSLGKW